MMNRHFRVAIFCCPSEEEKAWRVEGESLQPTAGGGESYSFNHILTESDGPAELHERTVSPLIASALEGRDVYVVAYGQPRTGKTHAVFGPSGQARLQRETRGILARIGQQVFDTVSNDRACKVSASFCHIFEDGRVTDLFDSRRRRLDVVEDRAGTNTFSIPSLTEHPVCSPLDLARLTEKAHLMRNASGCRREPVNPAARPPSGPPPHLYKPHCSHAIISVVVERLKGDGGGEGNKEGGGEGKNVVRSQITVVDLAGHSIGLVQAGQSCPDSGIETLHQVLKTLPSHGIVSAAGLFPQSSLTKLLKPCLGGNSETLLVGTLSLSEASVESTRRCLQVLQEASQIKNYSRRCLFPLTDSALGETLQQIANLKSDVCARMGVTEQAQNWKTGQDKGGNYIKINGHTYTDLSTSCSSLVQRINKLEVQILRNGVSSRKEKSRASVQSKSPVKVNAPAPAPAAVNIPPVPAKPLFQKPPHTKPVTFLPVTSTSPQQTTTTDLSSSSLDGDSSESDMEQASRPSTATSGPPPPPLRGIPHVKPDSKYIPPRQTSKPRPNAWRPTSGHSHQHEHSLASSSQVSSAVSSWSEAGTSQPHQHQPGSPVGSSRSSSARHTPTPSHPHTSHPPIPPSSLMHRPPFPLRGSVAIPLRPALPVQPVRLVRPVHIQPAMGVARPVLAHPVRPARPVFPLPAMRPHPQEASGMPYPLTSTPKNPSQLVSPTLGLPLSGLPSTHRSPSPTQPSTPGSLTPNPGSPALTPSPTPSPLPSPSSSPPPSRGPAEPSLPPLITHNLPLSQIPPRHLPPISENPVPFGLPSAPPHIVAGDNMSSSSSSITLTDSDLSQEARDTFDPVIRNRALSMHRTAPPYNGVQITGAHPINRTPVENAPPYEITNDSSSMVGGGGGEGEGRVGREGGGRGGLGDMSEYTSREEIHVAAMEGVKSSQLKKLAIQYGVDYRDHGGRTPLMYAVLGKQPRMCDTLLNLGAKVNTRDNTGLTPLLWATFQAKPQCMKILLRHGADIHTRDGEGRSVFHWAVKSPNIQCLKTLQRQASPAIVNTTDKEGLTPLHWAVLCNQPAHTHLLLTSTSADVNIQDREGRTALTHAVLNSSSACIKVILEASESTVNQRDEKGRTVLHYACAEDSTDCVRTLLTARSCDIHSRDNSGTTPLHWAAAANKPSILQLLLRRGADRSLRDSDELTAVEHAEVRGHTECTHILHNYGLRRPSSALSVASQVSVHTIPPPSLDKHGHVTLTRPQRHFSLSHSSLPRPPADGQAHPDSSSSNHTHGEESQDTQPHAIQQESDQGGGGGGRGRQWWRGVLCGCSRRNNVVIPAPVT